jgi:hypothetical protein
MGRRCSSSISPQGEKITAPAAGAVGSYYYTADHLSSMRELTDTSQTVQARWSYDLWGRRSQSVGRPQPVNQRHMLTLTGSGNRNGYVNGTTPHATNLAADDRLEFRVYLDPQSSPTEVMIISWNGLTGNYSGNASWGANLINFSPKASLGALPAKGRWTRLSATVAQLGLTGQNLQGVGSWIDGGTAYFDRLSLIRANGSRTVLSDETLPPRRGLGQSLSDHRQPEQRARRHRPLAPRGARPRPRSLPRLRPHPRKMD